MNCTIFNNGGKKELHYGEQHHAGVCGVIYQVSEKCIDLIRTCPVDQIQQVITHIEEVSRRVGVTNTK